MPMRTGLCRSRRAFFSVPYTDVKMTSLTKDGLSRRPKTSWFECDSPICICSEVWYVAAPCCTVRHKASHLRASTDVKGKSSNRITVNNAKGLKAKILELATTVNTQYSGRAISDIARILLTKVIDRELGLCRGTVVDELIKVEESFLRDDTRSINN